MLKNGLTWEWKLVGKIKKILIVNRIAENFHFVHSGRTKTRNIKLILQRAGRVNK